MEAASPSSESFAAPLVRPMSLVALVVLAINDHVLKGAHLVPGWLTGKLSDAAGLYLFPIMLFVVADGMTRLTKRRPAPRLFILVSAILTALVFTLGKLVPAVNDLMARTLGPIVPDPTDLLALPFAALAVRACGRSGWKRTAPGLLRGGALVSTLLVCAATQPAPQRGYPFWTVVHPAAFEAGRVSMDAWISKSGKEGLGATIALHASGAEPRRRVAIQSARFHAGSYDVVAAALPAPFEVTSNGPTYIYLPFAFDNQALWNNSVDRPELRHGLLTLMIQVDDQPAARLDIPLEQRDAGPRPYRSDRRPPGPSL